MGPKSKGCEGATLPRTRRDGKVRRGRAMAVQATRHSGRRQVDTRTGTMRGYFGIGVEGISKAANVGAVFRTAHAFGASFVFTVDPKTDIADYRQADTSNAAEVMPFYVYDKPTDLSLPRGCQLVGIELMDGSVDLPSFRHPRIAA